MAACVDAYSTVRSDDEKIVDSDSNNGDIHIKTSLFHGPGWYVPSERHWVNYDNYSALPRMTNRDAIDFQSEKEFINFLKKRDIPNYKKITAYFPSHPPSIKSQIFCQIPSFQARFRSPNETNPSTIRRGVDYYEYYREILDEMKTSDRRKLLSPDIIGNSYIKRRML
ncbi:unnamed protein product [Schistosoma mattheei]|uniref:Uncharacterized protein n=1 Tax=Schistosoma mattheei TaxID=31246 RepID=A0AA85BA35_9TREM|nr:unnamed protein product [Schistosoma mattheei]